jgi:hypothetical protein
VNSISVTYNKYMLVIRNLGKLDEKGWDETKTHVDGGRLRPGREHTDTDPGRCYGPDNVAPEDDDKETDEVDAEDYAEPRPGVFVVV